MTLVIWGGAAFYLPYYGQKLSQREAHLHYEKPLDVIAVFTGDKGRLKEAFRLTKNSPNTKIFISGVDERISFQSISRKQLASFYINPYSPQVEIDTKAKNTIENVIQTLSFARREKKLNTMIIVSSDYHIPRVHALISFFKLRTDETKFFVYALPTNPKKVSNIKRYFKEVLRFIKMGIVLLFWDK